MCEKWTNRGDIALQSFRAGKTINRVFEAIFPRGAIDGETSTPSAPRSLRADSPVRMRHISCVKKEYLSFFSVFRVFSG